MEWKTGFLVGMSAGILWLIANTFESRLLKQLIVLALASGCVDEVFGSHAHILGGLCIKGKHLIEQIIEMTNRGAP